MIRRTHRNNAGSAILVVVIFLFVVSVFASAFIALLNTNIVASNRAANRQETAALAEGGIEMASVLLGADPAYRGGPYVALGSGEVRIEIAPAEAAGHFVAVSEARRYEGDPDASRITAELAPDSTGLRIVRWEENWQ